MNEIVVQVARAEPPTGTVLEAGVQRWNDNGGADVLVATKIIFAGNQATTMAMASMLPEAMASEMAINDELATLRTELAELRAILMPARSLRVPSSPSRGPH